MQRVSTKMSPEEFLAWEREQPGKHHYVRGEIFDMSGGSARRNTLSAEIVALLANAVRGTECRAFSADQKIGVADDIFVYGDAVVACAPYELRRGTKDVMSNPVVIVEVLSKSTQAYDRTDKQDWYLALPSLRHLLFVSQNDVRVELYTRQDDGSFRFEILGPGATLTLSHPKAAIALDALYAGAFDLPSDD